MEEKTEEKRNPQVIISFADNPELYDALNKYRVSIGWTWKRVVLVGFANVVSKNQDNPDLVVAIADHLENKR